MEPLRLSDVLRATGGDLLGPCEGDPWIPAVTTDSKDVPPGALFVPLRGKRFDGHVFVDQAFLGGAAFSLVSRDADVSRMPRNVIVVRDTKRALGDLARWHRSRFDVPVIGITGSCGKTTVKEMLRQVLGEAVVVSHASFNNDVGVPLTLLRMDRSTRAAVVEIGTNAPGEIAALTNIARPTVGVLTNIEEAHLEGLGSLRGVMREKSALLHGLPEDGAAIVNADNYYCREVMEGLDQGTTISFGTWEDATVFGIDARPTANGLEFWLFGKMHVEVPALGMHNVSNALAAIAVGLWLGCRPDDIVASLRAYAAPPMRMSREQVGDVVLINDAYNANPGSMDAAIRELALRRCRGRRVAVLGDMLELGEESERLHRQLGRKVANEGVDLLWAVGPHAEQVASEAIGRGLPAGRVACHATVADAIAEPAFQPAPGDVWLFKASRGMALERLSDHIRAQAGALEPASGDVPTISRMDERAS
jgi:UDP-N-acetylmuramoyl-tripeptide--D-alanyl-D-alanine ligase